MARTACLVCFFSTVNSRSKKGENALEDVALVVGTQQNLSNLYSLDIYGRNTDSSENWKGKYHCTVDLLLDWFGISCMTTDNFCFYFQNRLIQTSQTGGQRYSDTSPFSIPWVSVLPLCYLCWINFNISYFLGAWVANPIKLFTAVIHGFS